MKYHLFRRSVLPISNVLYDKYKSVHISFYKTPKCLWHFSKLQTRRYNDLPSMWTLTLWDPTTTLVCPGLLFINYFRTLYILFGRSCCNLKPAQQGSPDIRMFGHVWKKFAYERMLTFGDNHFGMLVRPMTQAGALWSYFWCTSNSNRIGPSVSNKRCKWLTYVYLPGILHVKPNLGSNLIKAPSLVMTTLTRIYTYGE